MTRKSKKYDVKLNGNEAVLDEKLDQWYKNQNQTVKTNNGQTENGVKVDVSNSDHDVIDEEWERRNLRYGWGRLTPDCLQIFNNIGWYVFWNCVFSVCQGFVVHGVINAAISTLEKRFELPSSKSCLIASSYISYHVYFMYFHTCLQVFNNIGWYVFWNCVFSVCQGFVVHGVINAAISTLEKRFELPSSKSGLIAISNFPLNVISFVFFYLQLPSSVQQYRCLQVFNNIGWYVFWNCVFSVCQGFVVHGVINAVISTLEKRFELPSSKSGLIASSNDFLAFFLVLVISFYGSQRHKPRMIGIGVVVLGLGSIVFSLPHFLTGLYNYAGTDTGFENVCYQTNGTIECTIPEKTSSLQSYLYVFIIGNALHGAGSTPMFTLGTTFIDENSRAEQTPFFLGIIYCLSALGVAAGYMGGSQVLNVYTDVDKIDTKSVTITPMNPTWIGAWWMPFLVGGVIMFIVAIPLLGYPKRLPGSLKLQLQRKSETAKSKADSMVQGEGFGKSWRDFPKAIWNLLLNPTYVFLCLSGCAEGMIISGVATFGAKFLQEKFNLHPAFAGFIMGIITVPGAGGGMLLGGFIVKKMKLKCRGIIRMNLIAAVIGLVMSFTFLLQCPKQSIAGVTTEYITDLDRQGPTDLSSTCNVGCGCSAMLYEPVCGDGVIYFTPCHAGCSDNFTFLQGPMGPFKMYTNCSCVVESRKFKFLQASTTTPLPTTSLPMLESTESMEGKGPPPPGAYQGICMSDCKLLYAVAPLLFVGMLITFMTCSPTQTATMRCVPGNQRSLAIGLQWLLLRLLGTTPGPLMLGTIMDSACQTWQDLCGVTGSCWIYQKTGMGIKLFIWWCCVKVACIIFYFLAQYMYVMPESDDDGEEKVKLAHPVEELECKESSI